MSYTLTAGEIGQLVKARQLQTARARVTYFQAHGYMPEATNPQCRADVANVSFVNGEKIDCAVPLQRVGLWARTFPREQVLRIDVAPGEIKLSHNSLSWLKFFTWAEVIPGGKVHPIALADLGPPIRLTAPACGKGAFKVETAADADAELATLKVTLGKTRQQITERKAWGDARRKEREACAALRKGAKEAHAAKRTFASIPYADALARARACVAAKRLYRAARQSGPVTPDWIPERDEFAVLAVQKADTFKQWRDYVPPKSRCWRPNGHLTPKEKALLIARDNVAKAFGYFIDTQFDAYCLAHGLPQDLRFEWVCQGAYSKARNTVSEWPRRKQRLANDYREKILERKALEPKTP